MENIDPSNLPEFQIPQGFFEKLYNSAYAAGFEEDHTGLFT